MLKKYQELPPFIHTIITLVLVGLLLLFVFMPSLLGNFNLLACFIIILLLGVEVFFGYPKVSKKGLDELTDYLFYPALPLEEIKLHFDNDESFSMSRFDDDVTYYKEIDGFLVEIEFRAHFDDLKYVPKMPNIEGKVIKSDKKISMVFVLSESKKAKFFARYFAFLDKDSCDIAFTLYKNKLTQYTRARNEIIDKILQDYFIDKNKMFT